MGLDDRLDNIGEGKGGIEGGGRCHLLSQGTQEENQGCGNVLTAWKSRCGDSHPGMATGSTEGEARPLKPGGG